MLSQLLSLLPILLAPAWAIDVSHVKNISPDFTGCLSPIVRGSHSFTCGGNGNAWTVDIVTSDPDAYCATQSSGGGIFVNGREFPNTVVALVGNGSSSCTAKFTSTITGVPNGSEGYFVLDGDSDDAAENAANSLTVTAPGRATQVEHLPVEAREFLIDQQPVSLELDLFWDASCIVPFDGTNPNKCKGSNLGFVFLANGTVLGSSPSQAAKKRRRAEAVSQAALLANEHVLCPAGTRQCAIVGAGPGAFDCLEIEHELNSCGGCIADGTGVDCESLPNIAPGGVLCSSGTCHVVACQSGFAANGTFCEAI